MKLEKYKAGTVERILLDGDLKTFTIHTSSGSFSIQELEDGSLHIHEATHLRLAILPRQANALIIQAVEG